MANFDPKTRIERLLLKYPALHNLFKEAAPSVDEQLTVEEFCFANGLDFMEFFRKVDEAVKEEDARRQQEREQLEAHIAAGNSAVEQKVGHSAEAPAQSALSVRAHDPIVLGLLILSAIVFALSAIAYIFDGADLIRTVLGIHPASQFPHISQILCCLNIASLVGSLFLLFWHRFGVVPLLLGALINDTLVVTLTDSTPYQTVIAALVIVALAKIPVGGQRYKDVMKRHINNI